MKKLILILTILVLNNLEGTSQIVSDSTTAIPNSQLRKAINIIEKGKLVQAELELTKEKVIILEAMIDTKDTIIYNYSLKDVEWNKFYKNYQTESNNNKQYQANTQRIFEKQELTIKRSKKSKYLFLAIGLGLGLYLHK